MQSRTAVTSTVTGEGSFAPLDLRVLTCKTNTMAPCLPHKLNIKTLEDKADMIPYLKKHKYTYIIYM